MRVAISTISFAFLTGKERNKTASIKLKTVVFAPMPSASVMMVTAVKPGRFVRLLIP